MGEVKEAGKRQDSACHEIRRTQIVPVERQIATLQPLFTRNLNDTGHAQRRSVRDRNSSMISYNRSCLRSCLSSFSSVRTDFLPLLTSLLCSALSWTISSRNPISRSLAFSMDWVYHSGGALFNQRRVGRTRRRNQVSGPTSISIPSQTPD
jgi:hypothetical protein